MSSSRLILIFLGIIFLIIVILSSTKIAAFLRTRFGRFIPGVLNAEVTPTPTPVRFLISPTPTTKANPFTEDKNTVTYNTPGSGADYTTADQIPATGAAEIFWVTSSSTLGLGFFFRKLAGIRSGKSTSG